MTNRDDHNNDKDFTIDYDTETNDDSTEFYDNKISKQQAQFIETNDDPIEDFEHYTDETDEQSYQLDDDLNVEEKTTNSQVVENSNQPPEKQSNKWSMFLSGIAGGVTVAVIGFLLLSTGVLPLDQDQNQANTNAEATETASTSTDSNNETSNAIQTVASEDNSSLSTALNNVSEAVVGISNIQQVGLWTEASESGTGSGVIYKKEDGKAYVVTNNHVVDGANEVEVILTNGEHVNAKVLGTDELTDLAVLEIDGSNVSQVAALGSSSNLTVGETAIAIGNPLGTEFAGSVTKGIISGLERSVEMDLNSDGTPDWTTEVIQTDAAINPGNSGGALINSKGEVIGINSMKIALEAVEGIGFAIPIDEAKPIIEQLETNGSISRPFVGISAISLNTVPAMHKQQTLHLSEDVTAGIVVAQVQPGSAADKAGLERYDVIAKINDKDITSMMDLKQYLYSETSIGDKISITYYRSGEKQTTSLTLTEQSA